MGEFSDEDQGALDDSWEARLAGLLNRADDNLDALQGALARRLGRQEPLVIVPYTGYARADRAFVHGRVLANPGDLSAKSEDSLWQNLADMARRIDSDELPYPQVRVTLAGQETLLRGDEEGFFAAELPLSTEVPEGPLTAHYELLPEDRTQNDLGPVTAVGALLRPGPGAAFGVISDLDDTVLQSYATQPLRMLATMLGENAATRRPFAGVAAFYRALAGSDNPVFYLSSSPWNLHDLLAAFLRLQRLPAGPLLLRDWGITETEFLPTNHHAHKLARMRQVLDFYDPLPFLLIGDSGQQDPEIYALIANEYGARIHGALIRAVDPSAERVAAVAALSEALAGDGRALLVGADSLALAQAAVELGLLDQAVLARVRAAQEAADEAA